MSQKNDAPALIVSLLITLGLLGGGVWWLTQRSGLSNLPSLPQPSATSSSPLSTSTSPISQPPQVNAKSFAEVQAVPSGLFNYGGSTSWAPIRGQVDPEIEKVWSNFKLRYTQPPSGIPGSSTGIRMLLENQLSLTQSSRSLKPEEYQEAQTRGFKLKEIPVALEGIAIAVHPDLQISGLTLDQLRGIYSGQITNWSQLGGANVPIVPYSRRPEEGGTVEFFVENIMGGAKLGGTVQFVNTTTQAIQAVSSNLGGIYYASAPEVIGQCELKPVALGPRRDALIAPYQEPLIPASQCPGRRNQINVEAIQSGQYPLTRRLFVIVKQDGQADQQAGESYANLLLSDQGQDLLSKAGFVRLR